MWCFVFLVLIAIGGSSSSEIFRQCDDSECAELPLDAFSPNRAPDEAQLKVICKPTVDRFKCQKNVIEKCIGKTMEELATSGNVTVAGFAQMFIDIRGVITDICDEESLLHQSYVSVVDCFNTVLLDDALFTRCRKEATAVYETYMKSQNILGIQAQSMQDPDSECMVAAYQFACLTVDLRERCGELARATLLEVFKRIKFLTSGFSAWTCSAEQMSKLKTTYLDFLELEEEKRSWFSEAFETRRK